MLIACWGMMTLMVLVPGPDWAYIIASGMQDRTILPALTGILLGYLAAVTAVALGVGAALAALPWLLACLTFAAAGYLAYLGVRVLRQPAVVATATTAVGERGPARTTGTTPWLRLAQGAGVSGLNPKGLLVLIVLLPQFTDSAGTWPLQLQLAVLGLIFVGSCALIYSVVGLGASVMLKTRPSAATLLSRISGGAMVLVSIVLVIEQFVQFLAH